MKKITYALILLCLSFAKPSEATTYIVDVEDMEFDPAVLTVNVGDTIMWIWDEGFHTTTSSAIPSGATPWDQMIDQTNLMFMYIITVPGSYDYVCSYHASMGMVGHITANGATGINTVNAFSPVIKNTNASDELLITFATTSNWKAEVMNMSGAVIKQLTLASQTGNTSSVPVNDLAAGAYIIQLTDGKNTTSARFVRR